MTDAIDQFKTAMLAAGLTPPDVIEPGKERRFPGDGKSSKNRAAWCFMFDDMRGGVFGDFSSGLESTWQSRDSKPYTTAEKAANRECIQALQSQRDEAEKIKHTNAAKTAAAIWDKAMPIEDASQHGYLVKKAFKPTVQG